MFLALVSNWKQSERYLMSLYTHWTCFNCRKSFRGLSTSKSKTEGLITKRKCPECREELYNLGIYFQPPRRQAKKAWAIIELLAKNGYRFQTEGSTVYINTFILAGNKSRYEDVRQRIEFEKQSQTDNQIKAKIDFYKQEKRLRY